MSQIASFLGLGSTADNGEEKNKSSQSDTASNTQETEPQDSTVPEVQTENVTVEVVEPTTENTESLAVDSTTSDTNPSDLVTEVPVQTADPNMPELEEVDVSELEKEYGGEVGDGEEGDPDQDLVDEPEENIPEVKLTGVSDLQESLGEMEYEDVRKGLYHRFGLLVRDEQSIPGVYMITYDKSERDSHNTHRKRPELTQELQDLVHQYRGVIVEKGTNRPLCYTFNKMSRHLPDEWELSDCRVTESCDGSQIKVFYYAKEGYWVVSTTRRIDASRSYFFSNKSFMEMFQESSQNLNWDRLNKDCCYSFVMAHPDNRVVTRHEKPSLTHVLTRNMTTLNLVEDDIGIPKPAPVNFSNKGEMWRAVKRLQHWKEGFVVLHKPTNTYVKVINKKYQEVKNLRGSSSSLLYHFFDLRRRNKVNLFLKYFPEFQDTFRYFNDCFYNLSVLAYSEYVSLRVRRTIQPSEVLRFLKPVLYRVHGIHLTKHVRIRLSDVREHLSNYPPHILRRLVDMANGLPYSFI
jgi:hypothetical protein